MPRKRRYYFYIYPWILTGTRTASSGRVKEVCTYGIKCMHIFLFLYSETDVSKWIFPENLYIRRNMLKYNGAHTARTPQRTWMRLLVHASYNCRGQRPIFHLFKCNCVCILEENVLIDNNRMEHASLKTRVHLSTSLPPLSSRCLDPLKKGASCMRHYYHFSLP